MEKILKVVLQHPKKAFKLGRHTITDQPKAYDLNKAEVAELATPGPQKWLIEVEKKKAKKKDQE